MTTERLKTVAEKLGELIHCGRFQALEPGQTVFVILQIFDGEKPWEVRLEPLAIKICYSRGAQTLVPEGLFMNEVKTLPPDELLPRNQEDPQAGNK